MINADVGIAESAFVSYAIEQRPEQGDNLRLSSDNSGIAQCRGILAPFRPGSVSTSVKATSPVHRQRVENSPSYPPCWRRQNRLGTFELQDQQIPRLGDHGDGVPVADVLYPRACLPEARRHELQRFPGPSRLVSRFRVSGMTVLYISRHQSNESWNHQVRDGWLRDRSARKARFFPKILPFQRIDMGKLAQPRDH